MLQKNLGAQSRKHQIFFLQWCWVPKQRISTFGCTVLGGRARECQRKWWLCRTNVKQCGEIHFLSYTASPRPPTASWRVSLYKQALHTSHWVYRHWVCYTHYMYSNWLDSESVAPIYSATLYTNGVQAFVILWPNMYQDQGQQHVVAGEGMISVTWLHTLSEAKEHRGFGTKTLSLHLYVFIRQIIYH